ncbi:MAG TPA: hypothetical protein PLN85_00810 [archaeon]|jgi:hypothetical protein|nr:hypothetical protein [archaeon]
MSIFFKNDDEFSNLIENIISEDDINMSAIKTHDNLSSEIWKNENQLFSNIRELLLLNAKRFIEFSGIENIKFNDITLTGSMANYNYTDNSDLDVHIILDFKQISENIDFVGEFFNLKKILWSNTYSIKIKNRDVEMYFQDSSQKHHSSGVYSLLKNKWIVKPTKKIIFVDVENIRLKTNDLINNINDLVDNINSKNFLKNYNNLKNKIKNYREIGLNNFGEFSTENLVFKILRNNGYLSKLSQAKKDYLTNELSLNEIMI